MLGTGVRHLQNVLGAGLAKGKGSLCHIVYQHYVFSAVNRELSFNGLIVRQVRVLGDGLQERRLLGAGVICCKYFVDSAKEQTDSGDFNLIFGYDFGDGLQERRLLGAGIISSQVFSHRKTKARPCQ